ncbi:acetate uptake transporter [Nocardioides terrisoli]|uniref:acetate uptake transporter n=1 Tax=Nocardioides terrisoli TaxID=3388267 RepID=UPI00287B75A2|nr:acetate uptake transporter [Nocardioides marmorisolisilvae]
MSHTSEVADSGVLPRALPGAHIADPAPLGLAAFALTTFVLSFVNTGLFKVEPVVFGLALAYGGLAQLCAGMWEFAKGNTFGATAFASYGGFWISFWWLTGHSGLDKVTNANDLGNSLGLYLIAWAIFTGYMTIAATRVSGAVLAVFVLLTITYILLGIGEFAMSDTLGKIGGWVGVATALAAWYASFGGVTAFTHKRALVPTGPRE